ELRDELLAAVRAKKQDTSGPAHTAPTTGTERIAEGAETPLAESARLASNAAANGSDASVPLGGPEDTVDRSVPERGDDSLGVRRSKRLVARADDVAGEAEDSLSELLAPYRLAPSISRAGEIIRVPVHRVVIASLLKTETIISILAVLVILATAIVMLALGVKEAFIPI